MKFQFKNYIFEIVKVFDEELNIYLFIDSKCYFEKIDESVNYVYNVFLYSIENNTIQINNDNHEIEITLENESDTYIFGMKEYTLTKVEKKQNTSSIKYIFRSCQSIFCNVIYVYITCTLVKSIFSRN